MGINDEDLVFLARCVDLAEESLGLGDEPFGSMLVADSGEVLYRGHNEVSSGDTTAHPELAISQWALRNLSALERKNSTVYTSGEHCPMCAAAHGWAGLGRIVFVASSQMLESWCEAWGAPASPVAALPISQVVPSVRIDGPAPSLVPRIKSLHHIAFERQRS
ncbi:tRNA-specific adenosine deaminase [Arthrobacter sp. MYb227]|uniref:nucleoside deaminase n=1 Tax=Arthrobacter sp. MYb227 TaxID=1848601 RepID=UPI000CFE32DA|nr:nucleoside deaminase [Arthrobacter sp. MYb227]PQZ86674.1 tRNA-specific adenosine deaminase [Arthrobacter sp. MYb227]